MNVPEEPAPSRDERVAMLSALVDGDVTLAYRLAVELLDEGVAFTDLVDDVLSPVQRDLGRRWAAGELGIADEHAASAAIEELVVRLAATLAPPDGPDVVVACAEHDAHALGGRVVAAALALDGFRVRFLGASLPAADLAEFLALQSPLALALSVSVPSALVSAVSSIATAHALGIPVVAGGRVFTRAGLAARVGADAFARTPADAVARLRAWQDALPSTLARAPAPLPELDTLDARAPALIAAVLAPDGGHAAPPVSLADELGRLLRVVGAALLLDDPALVHDQVGWLRATGPAHGVERGPIEGALAGLADAMGDDLRDARDLLRSALR